MNPSSARPARVVVVGSLNVDSVVRLPRFPRPGETVVGESHALYPGGKGANQAYAAARLARPGSVRLVGQVGGDGHGAWLKDHLAAGGVDVGAVGTDPDVGSGIAVIAIDGGGQNQIMVVPGANGTLTPERLAAAAPVLAEADLVLLQLEVPMETTIAAARMARLAGARVILDPAPARELPDALLEACDFVTPNESELATITGAPTSHGATIDQEQALAGARTLRSRGAKAVIVKMGSAGALFVADGDPVRWPAFAVTAVDTTAAGDAWNGAFAVALSEGQALETAGRFACAAAAISVTRRGAQPSMPSRAEVEAFLAR